MKKLLLVNFLFLLVFTAKAQKDFRPGYIVNLQGDTLKGEINYKGDLKNTQECAFRANSKATIQEYKPQQLLAYGFNGGKFYEAKTARIVNRYMNRLNKIDEVAVAGNDSVNFMQVLVKGTASLYIMTDATDEQHYFLQQRDEMVKELVYLQTTFTNPETGLKAPYRSKLYVGVLKVAFKDCTLIGPQIDNTELKASQLIELFSDYNKCVAPTKKIITLHRQKPVLTWGAMAGLSFSKLNIVSDFSFLDAGEFNSKAAPTAAVFADFNLPFVNEKLSINNALFYTRRNYTANYNYASSDLAYSNYRVAFEFDYLRLETALRYTVPSVRFMPYVQVGLSNSFMLTNNEEITSTKYYMNYTPEENQDADVVSPILRKHQLGFVGAAGLKHNLPNGMPVFIQANYEFNTGFTKAIGIGTRSHNMAILVGVNF